MGNTLCNDCKNTKTGEICCDTTSTTVEPTFKMPLHFEPAIAPELPSQIDVRMTSLENCNLSIIKILLKYLNVDSLDYNNFHHIVIPSMIMYMRDNG